ncbi:hypothetical protein [Dictyobacter aurantiacus]|uniref:hypothetical protein n=1 Tax=Dictyobacter aurantiacus TaxID=1936993 RepID=UPI000F81A091|nr:hypothetical protein [Dictyobacter aurantiacus]
MLYPVKKEKIISEMSQSSWLEACNPMMELLDYLLHSQWLRGGRNGKAASGLAFKKVSGSEQSTKKYSYYYWIIQEAS